MGAPKMRCTSIVAFVILLGTGAVRLTAEEPVTVKLWPGDAPNESGNIGEEYVRMSPELDRKQVEVTESTRMVTNVTQPAIYIYRPPKETDTGTAMLICPGGGYWNGMSRLLLKLMMVSLGKG